MISHDERILGDLGRLYDTFVLDAKEEYFDHCISVSWHMGDLNHLIDDDNMDMFLEKHLKNG